MQRKTAVTLVAHLTSLTLCLLMERPLPAGAADTPAWKLPQGVVVRDQAPRTYRFTVDYRTVNNVGGVVRRQRVTGDYTRGLPGGDVMWRNVSQADAEGPAAPFGEPQGRVFMEGFRYHDDLGSTIDPGFFKAFPPSAVFERNLVWDTGMIVVFGQDYFGKLRLNEPFHVIAGQDVQLPGVGTFHNRDVVLEWVGRSRRNGLDCALIDYEAFLNPLQIVNGGMTLVGRSDYWGQIWVSLGTRQIEFATLNEVVGGELKLPGQDAAQRVDVFRRGTFAPLATR